LLCLGGAIITYVALVLIPNLGISLGAMGGDFRPLGGLFGLAVVACGGLTLYDESYALRAGITGMVCSLLSFLGAFGGFVLGALLGVCGGGLCISTSLELGGDDTEETHTRQQPVATAAGREYMAETQQEDETDADHPDTDTEHADTTETSQRDTDQQSDAGDTDQSRDDGNADQSQDDETGAETGGGTLFGTDEDQ
jgi:hypothetical protein